MFFICVLCFFFFIFRAHGPGSGPYEGETLQEKNMLFYECLSFTCFGSLWRSVRKTYDKSEKVPLRSDVLDILA